MNTSSKLTDNMESILLFFQDLETPYKIGNKEVQSLVHILSKVKYFRIEKKTVYRLENLLAICFLLALKGELHSFCYVETYLRVKEDEFVK